MRRYGLTTWATGGLQLGRRQQGGVVEEQGLARDGLHRLAEFDEGFTALEQCGEKCRERCHRFPPPLKRPIYVLASSLCLIAMLLLWQPLGGVIWSFESTFIESWPVP